MNGLPQTFIKTQNSTAKGFKAALLNFVTPTNASWNGHNASVYGKRILLM